MILVTGATGNVGSAVVRELSAHGAEARAFVRDVDAAREQLGDGVELAEGDFDDGASLRAALTGVDAVFLAYADGPRKVGHETAVIDAAAGAGVRLIVKGSTVRAEAGSPLPPFDWNGRIEQHLRRSGVPAVVLQSTFYMTNLLASAEPIRQTGTLFAPLDGASIAMIDPRDVAAVAGAVLTTRRREGATLVLTGPEAITYAQVAADLTAANGRRIEFVPVPDEAARQSLVAAGMPAWVVEHLSRLFPLIREGALAETTETVAALTGRPPLPFAQFARDNAAVFGRAAVAGSAGR